jgi:hypothetical protein
MRPVTPQHKPIWPQSLTPSHAHISLFSPSSFSPPPSPSTPTTTTTFPLYSFLLPPSSFNTTTTTLPHSPSPSSCHHTTTTPPPAHHRASTRRTTRRKRLTASPPASRQDIHTDQIHQPQTPTPTPTPTPNVFQAQRHRHPEPQRRSTTGSLRTTFDTVPRRAVFGSRVRQRARLNYLSSDLFASDALLPSASGGHLTAGSDQRHHPRISSLDTVP